MIRGEGLTKRYGHTLALDRLSLEVPRGSVLGLLGPNGAGKTTFLRLVMGFIFPDEGRVDRGQVRPHRIGYMPERAFYPSRVRAHDYMWTVGRLSGLPDARLREDVPRLLEQLELKDFAGARLGTYSRGMLQRLGLAQALLGDPALLLLDEPVAGLDPAGQRFFREQILMLREAGQTVVLSSHNLGEVTRVCTHIAVLNRGRLVRSGSLESMMPSKAEVTIVTGPMPATLPSQLRALGPGIIATDGRVRLVEDAVQHKAAVLRALLDAGVDVLEVSQAKSSLEDAFLEATEA